MKILRQFFILLLFVLGFSRISGQSISSDTILSRIGHQFSVYPQEKVYVHTDKADYIGGETIWMRAYVTDASTHIPVWRSRYVYVELINPFDSVVCRVKFRRDSLGLVHGNMKLGDTIP